VRQKGSNITRDRLRFDFSHPNQLLAQERADVERLVNEWLSVDLEVTRQEMTPSEARALGAVGAFGEKYGQRVSVYSIVDPTSGAVVSREFCGGPHVHRTAEIVGHFSIVREEALGANVRRIKAVLTDPGRASSPTG
jgi:alanyl-tRNA synthetase